MKDKDLRKEQEYMHVKAADKARLADRIRTKMIRNVKMNFKNLYKGNLKCDKCESGEEESQEHMMVCTGWEEERGSLDLTMMKDQVEFMMKVMRRKTR